MTTFDKIATDLLHTYGYEVQECTSDQEAIELAEKLRAGSMLYPVHFSQSDTSGEKGFEEFYTEMEQIDQNRFQALGVITKKEIPDKNELKILLEQLETSFKGVNVSKEDIINILEMYLPSFQHIEKGKSLDSKM